MKLFKVLLIILVVPTTISCVNNEEKLSNKLVGKWIRSDVRNDFEYKLIFNSNKTGYRIVKTGTMETEAASSLLTFNWSVKDTTLKVEGIEEDLSESNFSFNSEEKLIINKFQNLYFTRVE